MTLKVLLRGTAPTERASHGNGNVYAPHLIRVGRQLRMYYGGQGRDGHDRIHLAISRAGDRWVRYGVVIERGKANHVNDPSVVQVNGLSFMFYGIARTGLLGSIALATSADGLAWRKRGVVFGPGPPGTWDCATVDRPSVLYEGGLFHMWYDGRPAMPPDPTQATPRRVGHAESRDGVHWSRETAPVLGFGAGVGAVDVSRSPGGYVMYYEGVDGTHRAEGPDPVEGWIDLGLCRPLSGGAADRYGHVTPHWFEGTIYVGAASGAAWDNNCIARIEP